MEIVCEGCGAKLSVPEDKLPATGSAQAICPKCKGKIIIARGGPEPAPAEAHPGPAEAAAYSSNVLEKFEEGVPAALVIHADDDTARHIGQELVSLGYRISRAADAAEAQARIKFNPYEVIVLQEGFGAAGEGASPVLEFLDTLPMSQRRQMLVAMVSRRLATFDRMAAFLASVNVTISEADLPDFGKILKNSVAEHELFYSVFNETLKGLGRN